MGETIGMAMESEDEPKVEVDRHDERIMKGLQQAPVYKKQGEVAATIAKGGEVVITQLADGTSETKNTANPGDAIITNPGGEQYIIGADKFLKRYEPKMDDQGEPVAGVFAAKGYCKAIDNPFGAPITMMASWGEMQNGAKDALIADTYDPDTNLMGGEPYIIGNAEFAQTYKLAGNQPD